MLCTMMTGSTVDELAWESNEDKAVEGEIVVLAVTVPMTTPKRGVAHLLVIAIGVWHGV